MWKMPIDASTRERVFERAYWRCEMCHSLGKPYNQLEIHHIVTKARGVGWTFLNHELNLCLLCHGCHMNVHKQGIKQWLSKRPPDVCYQCDQVLVPLEDSRGVGCQECKEVLFQTVHSSLL